MRAKFNRCDVCGGAGSQPVCTASPSMFRARSGREVGLAMVRPWQRETCRRAGVVERAHGTCWRGCWAPVTAARFRARSHGLARRCKRPPCLGRCPAGAAATSASVYPHLDSRPSTGASSGTKPEFASRSRRVRIKVQSHAGNRRTHIRSVCRMLMNLGVQRSDDVQPKSSVVQVMV